MSTSLQNLTVPPQNLLNTPLNLSLGSNNSNGMMGNHAGASSSSSSSSSSPSSSSILNPGQGGTQMPQLILASGQLVQGIQGAQLLIPTSQGEFVERGIGRKGEAREGVASKIGKTSIK